MRRADRGMSPLPDDAGRGSVKPSVWKVLAVAAWLVALVATGAAAFSAFVDATNGTPCDPVPCEGKAGRALALLVVGLALVAVGTRLISRSRRERPS